MYSNENCLMESKVTSTTTTILVVWISIILTNYTVNAYFYREKDSEVNTNKDMHFVCLSCTVDTAVRFSESDITL